MFLNIYLGFVHARFLLVVVLNNCIEIFETDFQGNSHVFSSLDNGKNAKFKKCMNPIYCGIINSTTIKISLD